MAAKSHHPHSPGKSKTDLRRGHFTPVHHAVAKPVVRAAPKATGHAEQALLFDLSLDPPRHVPHAKRK